MSDFSQRSTLLTSVFNVTHPFNNVWEHIKSYIKVERYGERGGEGYYNCAYSGKRLSEIQTKLCLAWFIARDTVPHTTAHRYSTLVVW